MRIGEHINNQSPAKPTIFQNMRQMLKPKMGGAPSQNQTNNQASTGSVNRNQSSANLTDSVGLSLKKKFQVTKVKNQVGVKIGNFFSKQNNKSMRSVLDDSDVIADGHYKAKYKSLTQLRRMEFASSVKIQTMVRAYFTRKWYVNLQVRKRLSVPFSGLEFA